jgi:hypothetical protein
VNPKYKKNNMKEISQKTIKKISQIKLENCRNKIIEGFSKNNIPKQSQIKLAVPTHRTKKWISFEQFKTLITQGKTLQELCQIYSKHLIAFYSYLSKGKITLTKNQFEKEYNKGISLDKIARSNNIPREHITYLREYYGIKRKGATYQRRLQNEKNINPISIEAEEILIGSLLGDGHITDHGEYREKHSEKQVEYLEWKSSFFKDIINQKAFYGYSYIDNRSGNKLYIFGFRTIVHSKIIKIKNLFYKNIDGKRTKILPNNIHELITPKALMVWFLDDGHTDWRERHKIKYPTQNTKYQCKISSESFTLKENQILQKILKEKFGLIANISFKKRGNIRPYLRFTLESSKKLLEIIGPLVQTKDMKYKINENEFIKRKELTDKNKEDILKNFISKHLHN